MSDLESSFLQAIARQPHDWLPRLIFADWLDEQGDPRGELIRLSHQLTRLECEDRPQKEARLQSLPRMEKEIKGGWRRTWSASWPSPSVSNSLNMKFVLIPPGQFRMGSPLSEEGRRNDETQVEVTLTRGFWLGRYVIIQQEWRTIMHTAPWAGKFCSQDDEFTPATYVNWDDAGEFCAKLTAKGHQESWLARDWRCDLPTEAQWEYACRAGTSSRFCFGNADNENKQDLWKHGWFDMNAWANNADEIDYYYPRDGGRHKPNRWGLYDMHGGVWEWCRDSYTAQLPGGTDPEVREQSEGRVCRGGSWLDEHVSDCRSAIRASYSRDRRDVTEGFRVALVQCR